MVNNPILKTLQENDLVLMEIPSTERSNVKQICRIYDLEFEPADNDFKFDWLTFKVEILYTNIKLHQSILNQPIGNCLSIVEKVDSNHLEEFSRVNDMWKADQYLLSDEELEYNTNRINRMVGL